MELLLMCIAVAYTLTGKFNKDTNQAAYTAGKEPPGLVKARMRHESGGGARKPSGKPTGKGSTRLLLSQRWANACEKAKDRADDKHRRWRAWYADQAESRDEQWRTKQATRIAKSEARAEKFAGARGILAHPVDARRDRQAGQQAWQENARRDATARPGAVDTADTGENEGTSGSEHQSPAEAQPHGPQRDTEHATDPRSGVLTFTETDTGLTVTAAPTGNSTISGIPEDPSTWTGTDRYGRDIQSGIGEVTAPDGASGVRHDTDREGLGSTVSPERKAVCKQQFGGDLNVEYLDGNTTIPTAAGTTNQSGEATVYDAAAARLHAAAEQIDQYRADLAAMADGLAAKQWGTEVHGPIGDMDQYLADVAGSYRDLAGQMQQQGDSVNDAHDEYPYVPGGDAVLA